jgi:hypothetical protein
MKQDNEKNEEVNIIKHRLKELLHLERVLQALQAGGVDN